MIIVIANIKRSYGTPVSSDSSRNKVHKKMIDKVFHLIVDFVGFD